jgi:hypothetical protein
MPGLRTQDGASIYDSSTMRATDLTEKDHPLNLNPTNAAVLFFTKLQQLAGLSTAIEIKPDVSK